ncbi:hypothetical protein ACFVGY_14600 [Streptomyces sp. NPDC127106]|uniref:hypothetical protein n=1 Tax=Streptomyces sp. NPDC127106 TaxID=3345360 RepID=UPI0036253CBE
MLVQTRSGALVQDRWSDLVAAAEEQLPHDLVLDGELVVWAAEAGRLLSFEALQRRAAARARGAPALVLAGAGGATHRFRLDDPWLALADDAAGEDSLSGWSTDEAADALAELAAGESGRRRAG